MNSIFPWLGIAVLILCGWAIVKKYQVNMVLLLGGLILNLLAFWGGAEIFPKKFSATGIVGFDLIELLRTISVSQVSGVGFLILISGGFAAYMQAIGASDRFVTVCAKPLSLIKNPYLILAAVFIVGHCLGLVITSAAGLAMLMVVTVYPLIIRVGCSPLAAAAVVASVLAIGYAPASGTANFASELVHLDPIEYLVRYQLPMAVPTILAMAAAQSSRSTGLINARDEASLRTFRNWNKNVKSSNRPRLFMPVCRSCPLRSFWSSINSSGAFR